MFKLKKSSEELKKDEVFVLYPSGLVEEQKLHLAEEIKNFTKVPCRTILLKIWEDRHPKTCVIAKMLKPASEELKNDKVVLATV